MQPILKLTNLSQEINLLNDSELGIGFFLRQWNPTIAEFKNGGIFNESTYNDGRTLTSYSFGNVVETFEITLKTNGTPQASRYIQAIRRMLVQASDYFASENSLKNVYLVVRAPGELNTRYAIIQKGEITTESGHFAQPFLQPSCTRVITDMTLNIERGHWVTDYHYKATDIEAYSSQCVDITGDSDYYALYFDGVNDYANMGSHPTLDNLPAAGFVVEAWARLEKFNASSEATLFAKDEWRIAFTSAGLLMMTADFTTTDLLATTTFVNDGRWHYFRFIFHPSTVPKILIDGIEVTYVSQVAPIGTFVPDFSDDLIVGSFDGTSDFFNGSLGWFRFTEYLITSDNERCDPPVADVADTTLIAQYNLTEGTGTTIFDAADRHHLDGTLVNGVAWHDACSPDGERCFGNEEATSEWNDLFISNKYVHTNLTHMFSQQAGTFSVNLIDSVYPVTVWAATPTFLNGSKLYIGISESYINGSPFDNVVFNISQALSGTFNGKWRYSTTAGTFVDFLTFDDNGVGVTAGVSESLDAIGTYYVAFHPPVAWKPITINGVTAFWIVYEFTSGSSGTNLILETRPYTTTWNYITLNRDQVPGDIPALLKAFFKSANANFDGFINRTEFIMGTKTINETDYDGNIYLFQSFINLSDNHNIPGINVSFVAGTGWRFENFVPSPSGRMLTIDTASTALKTFTVTFLNEVSRATRGRYRMFLLANTEDAGVDEGYNIRYDITSPDGEIVSDYIAFISDEEVINFGWNVIDFGEVNLGTITAPIDGFVSLYDNEETVIEFNLVPNTANPMKFMGAGLVLIPTDEFNIEGSGAFGQDMTKYLVLDNSTDQRLNILAENRFLADNSKQSKVVTTGNLFYQHHQTQSLHTFWYVDDNEIANTHYTPETNSRVKLQGNFQYLDLRGDE